MTRADHRRVLRPVASGRSPGVPEPSGWDPLASHRRDAVREAEVAARVAAAQAKARINAAAARARRVPDYDPDEPPSGFDAYDQREAEEFAELGHPWPHGPRCEACGYRVDAPGHLIACGSTP